MSQVRCNIKTEKMQTPIGVGNFVYLVTPTTKFDKDGSYETTMVFDLNKPEVQKMVGDLEGILRDVVGFYDAVSVAHKITNPITQPAGDLAPPVKGGNFIRMKFKSKRPIAVFDSTLQPLAKDVELYSGCELRVAFQPIPYHMSTNGGTVGLSLRLIQAQVISLSDQTPVFDAVEGGFAQEDSEELTQALVEALGDDPFGLD